MSHLAGPRIIRKRETPPACPRAFALSGRSRGGGKVKEEEEEEEGEGADR